MINYINPIFKWFRNRQKTVKCQNCNHYDFGMCKRYPPQVTLARICLQKQEHDIGYHLLSKSHYPIVDKNDYCAEFE